MPLVAVFDAKPHDREFLGRAGDGRVEWRFVEARLDADMASAVDGATAVCAFVNDKLDRPCLEALSLRGVGMVAMRCAGHNNLDLAAARALGVKASRVPAYSPNAVAEHAIGLLLTLNRKIHRAFNRVREQNFALGGLLGFDIAGKTAGVVGTGRIGRVAARILRGFDARVLLADPFPDAAWAASIGAEYVDLPRLLAQSDVVTLHAPLTPQSLHMLDANAFSLMKHGAYVVNTSRGKLIDTRALIAALKSGKLGGVALDVYEEEEGVFFEDLSDRPLLDDALARLLTFPNVLVTAHQAFFTREALAQIAETTVSNILAFDEGREFLPDTELA